MLNAPTTIHNAGSRNNMLVILYPKGIGVQLNKSIITQFSPNISCKFLKTMSHDSLAH